VVENGFAMAAFRGEVADRDDRTAAVKSRRESMVKEQETALGNASFEYSYQPAI